MDVFVALAQQNLEESDDVAEGLAVENTDFIDTLRRPLSDWSSYGKKGSFSHVYSIGKEIEAGTIIKLFFPANIHDKHWAVYCIDVAQRVVLYGDSLGWKAPDTDISAISHWLSKHHLEGFTFSASLECAQQVDNNFSCGIIAANTIDHALFGTDLWDPASRDSFCLSKVINIFDSHLRSVRPKSLRLKV